MSIKKGNQLFKSGDYHEAIDAYKTINKNSPLYPHAKSNIERAIAKIKNDKNAHKKEKKSSKKIFITKFNTEVSPPVKGIKEGKSLTHTTRRLKKESYYKLTLSAEQKLNATISIRDKNRNLPLYQNYSKDISQDEHIFFTPPSIKDDIILSIHPNDETLKLEELKNKLIVAIECIGGVDEVSFKPKSIKKKIIASMATTKSRLDIAIDAAYSLLSQVDKLYIHINDAEAPPLNLAHKKIFISTKKEHGDLGDSAKFIGIKNENRNDAYALVCDDDFIFPYDFIIQSYLKLEKNKFNAIIGMHGIFPRYPIEDYYGNDARNTMHITTGFSFEPTVSIVGTGAVFFDTQRFPVHNFVLDHKNMADIWFSIECNQAGLPILIQKRRTNWVIDNPPSENAYSIWQQSIRNTTSTYNTRSMQTYVLTARKHHLKALPLITNEISKDFALILDDEIYKKNIEAIKDLSKTSHSPNVIVVLDCKDISKCRQIGRGVYAEIIFLSEKLRRNMLDSLFNSKEFKFALQFSNEISLSAKKIKNIINIFRDNYTEITTSFDMTIFSENKKETGLVRYLTKLEDSSAWSIKFDARVSSKITEKILNALEVSNFKSIADPNFLQNKNSASQKSSNLIPKIRFKDYFDKIYLLNLDRRADRLKEFENRAEKWGINFQRVSAVDGSLNEIKARHKEIQEELIKTYGSKGFRFKYESSSYWEYKSEGERISHLLLNNGKTYSAGGFGYLMTYKKIIEDAMNNHYKRIAVFDDDCLFHSQLDMLFSQLLEEIPEDWVTISLGSLQYEWRDKYISWWSDNTYRCGGHSVGSHAQAYSKMAFPLLLEHINRLTLPFDVGALHYLKRYYSTKSFTAFPNLFIQDVSDTDIGDSKTQLSEGAKKNNTYKWDLANYE